MLKQLVKVRPFFKDHVYTIRRGLAKGLKRKGGLSFIPQFGKPSQEEEFLSTLDLSCQTIFDIGAFEGVFTLFFARSVGEGGRVYTFEPNPINYNRILENLSLNNFNQVQVLNTALGDREGQLDLQFKAFEAGSGSLHTEVQSNLPKSGKVKQIKVPIDTLDHQIKIEKLPDPDFVKIDVEGFEPNVLKGMKVLLKRNRPTLFIELHGFLLKKERASYWQEIVDPLLELGYTIKHIENELSISSSRGKPPLTGHLFCWVGEE